MTLVIRSGAGVAGTATLDTDPGGLPATVAAALDAAAAPRRSIVPAAGIPYAVHAWGASHAPPVLLVHGIAASAGTWWRVAPAIAAAGYRVLAIDQPGHGETGHWSGHHRFRDNARDLAEFIDAAGLGPAALAVVGHSWGAMTVAALPGVGARPERLVLLDPPVVPRSVLAGMGRGIWPGAEER